MDPKAIQSRIETEKGRRDLSRWEEMCRVYVLLDDMAEGRLSKVRFWDDVSRQELIIKRSETEENTFENGCAMLSKSGIDCAKKVIARYFLNPHDARWTYADLEAVSPLEKEVMRRMRLKETEQNPL